MGVNNLLAAAVISLAGATAAGAISDEGWFCPPGTELYQGQCWAPTQPEQPRGDVTSSAQSSSNASVTVNNQIRGRHSAASAVAPQLNGYAVPNCFGDVNPSGSFTAGMQTFGWGVAAGSSKASNVCAVYAIGGPAAAMAYLQKMDRNVPRSIAVETRPRVTCPPGSTWDGKGCWKPR